MVMPGLNTYPVALLDSLYKYAALGPTLETELARQRIASGGTIGAANAAARGGVQQQQIQAGSDWAQLLPALASDYQNRLQDASFRVMDAYSQGGLRNPLSALFWQQNLGPQPEAGSAIPGGIPALEGAFAGPLNFLPQVRAQAGAGPTGDSGRRTYSAAGGMRAQ